MSKHTPGPWRAVRRTVAYCYVGGPKPDACEVQASFVEPLGLQVYGPDWKHDYRMNAKGRSNYICGNALLIAAAPDLLAAAKQAEKLIRNGGVVPVRGMAWTALTAAIAKAEGRS